MISQIQILKSNALKDHFKFLSSELLPPSNTISYSVTNQGKREAQYRTAVPMDQDDGRQSLLHG
jgi:uncharacterized protein involved in high-affinity Fe2+ transport